MGESYSVGACCAKGVPFLLSPLIITDPAACYCVRHVYRTTDTDRLASFLHNTVTNISVATKHPDSQLDIV